MSTLTDTGFPTLMHWAQRQDPDGSVAQVANLLSKKNPILDDVPWVEGNLPTGHRVTAATGLPSATWRKLNSGAAATKASTQQFDETCGILEDESKVDIALAKLNGNEAAYRASEDKLKIEAFGQQFATALFYESAASNPERIHGLTPRYPATSGYTASSYVTVPGTNAGVNAHSVWLITWEERKIYGVYPKGSTAGLQVKDRGEQRVLDSSSNAFYAYCTQFIWNCGIAVEDYRYAVRMQWDPDDANFSDGDRAMYLAMQGMLTTIFDTTPNTMFYMDRTSKAKLDSQLASNDANFLTYVEKGGRRLPSFMGVPIRVVDSLVAETAIS